jgi:hypothetical protein
LFTRGKKEKVSFEVSPTLSRLCQRKKHSHLPALIYLKDALIAKEAMQQPFPIPTSFCKNISTTAKCRFHFHSHLLSRPGKFNPFGNSKGVGGLLRDHSLGFKSKQEN